MMSGFTLFFSLGRLFSPIPRFFCIMGFNLLPFFVFAEGKGGRCLSRSPTLFLSVTTLGSRASDEALCFSAFHVIHAFLQIFPVAFPWARGCFSPNFLKTNFSPLPSGFFPRKVFIKIHRPIRIMLVFFSFCLSQKSPPTEVLDFLWLSYPR